MGTNIRLFIALLALTAGLSGCHQSEYERMLARELASGERHDSLFLGISLGMTNDDFYNHCWQLNRQRLVKEGIGNMTVEYVLPDVKPEMFINFYPEFDENKIYQMPVTFAYRAWAPWNRHLWSDSLQVHVLQLLEKWYGPGFIEVTNPERGTVHVKVDGNRRILVSTQGDDKVKVIFTDMLVKPKEEAPEPVAPDGEASSREIIQ